jgi:hypothetical protein
MFDKESLTKRINECLRVVARWSTRARRQRSLLHVLAAIDRDIGAGHERRLVRA